MEGNSKVEKEIPEILSKNLISNKFHQLDSANINDDICKFCREKNIKNNMFKTNGKAATSNLSKKK